jgi:glycosyltransferase involved in cell wall biosynthesis
MLLSVSEMLWVALRLKADVYHLHDPEILPTAPLLKLTGARVVADIHEYVPQQIIDKYWIPRPLRRFLGFAYGIVELPTLAACDLIVVAVPDLLEEYPSQKTIVVQNFPRPDEFIAPDPLEHAHRPLQATYIGAISEYRGAKEMVQAVGLLPDDVDCSLVLAGPIRPESLESELEALDGWRRTRHLGWLDREAVIRELGCSRVGLVVLHPRANHLRAWPVKMFEYMSAGLPIIASEFPLWRQIVEPIGCGILVDPLDTGQIRDALQRLFDDPAEAARMGARGREAVLERYNWDLEAERLIAGYEELALPDPAAGPCV